MFGRSKITILLIQQFVRVLACRSDMGSGTDRQCVQNIIQHHDVFVLVFLNTLSAFRFGSETTPSSQPIDCDYRRRCCLCYKNSKLVAAICFRSYGHFIRKCHECEYIRRCDRNTYAVIAPYSSSNIVILAEIHYHILSGFYANCKQHARPVSVCLFV